MKFELKSIKRTVELIDDLVNEYKKLDDLRENQFCIIIISKYGDNPSKEEVSDEELSALCNKILFSSLKALSLLPNALKIVNENEDKLDLYSKLGVETEFSIDV